MLFETQTKRFNFYKLEQCQLETKRAEIFLFVQTLGSKNKFNGGIHILFSRESFHGREKSLFRKTSKRENINREKCTFYSIDEKSNL